ncbi:hypothetical protein KKD80_03445 [Patescibacteria group bacterium]|nr:hypothetical protein [Patescibacteria group bacterium]
MQTTITIGVILLAVIAYFLWKIYHQREEEKREDTVKAYNEEKELKKKEFAEKYPHLVGKLEGNWLQVFAHNAENGVPLLKLSFMLMLQESTKIDYSEGSMKWDTLWDCTEELLEHLEKFHEGSIVEHEIAVTAYWQVAAEAVGELVRENPEIEGSKLEVEPYTNINKIALLFPKKANHPAEEISFLDEKGSFPRKSNGSAVIKDKLKSLGL